jgi:hypothetical protein
MNTTANQQSTPDAIPVEAAYLRRLSIRQTYQLVGISRTALNARMKRGEIEFQRDGSRAFFTADAIAAYQERLKRHAKGGAMND